jgi:hypothetical protein
MGFDAWCSGGPTMFPRPFMFNNISMQGKYSFFSDISAYSLPLIKVRKISPFFDTLFFNNFSHCYSLT